MYTDVCFTRNMFLLLFFVVVVGSSENEEVCERIMPKHTGVDLVLDLATGHMK
jgi:hypothetical protein